MVRGSWWLAACMVPMGCYSGVDTAGQDADAPMAETDDAGESGGDTDSTGPGDDTDGDDGQPAGCSPDDVPLAALVRMNQEGYVHALRDIFGPDLVDDLEVSLDAIPTTHIGHFSTELGPPSYAEVSAQVNAAFTVATHLTRNESALTAISSCLPDVDASADLLSDPCLSELTRDYGLRILRRPLTDNDFERFAADYQIGADHNVAEGVATLLAAMLIDPDFLYDRIEGEEVGDGIVRLNPHETAARLARVLWNSAPDAELLAAADGGLDQPTLRAEAERMLDDPRARAALGGFFFDWLELESVPFAALQTIPNPDARTALRDAMGDSVTAFATATILDAGGTYADLLLDRTAYIDDMNLAVLYGVEVSAGPVQLPPERAGLLTRAGFVATQEIPETNAGHIIKRGARLSAFICRPLPLPDAAAFPEDDPAEPGSGPAQGIRERFANATSEATCASCHVQLDGLGAPLGHFGDLGQWIDTERVGEEELPINTAAEVLIDGQTISVDNPVALSEALASSQEGPRCLAESLARNMLGRELTDDDSCMVEALSTQLAGEDEAPAAVREALLDFVVSDRFRHVRTP